MELEARKTLEMLTPSLKDLTVIANVTLARSKIELEKTNLTAITNFQRPMVNQAPYVLNLAVDYENEPLGKVRRCLLDALYMDPTPFGFRAAMRVRTARTTAALIEIVWEMERDMGLSMRSRSGLQNLQRARELLGLGNTLVDEDSQSPRTDDDDWR